MTTGFVSQPMVTQPLVSQPLAYPATTTASYGYGYSGQVATMLPPVTQAAQVVSGASQIISQSRLGASYTGQTIKGESRVEYIPYEKSYIEYEELRR